AAGAGYLQPLGTRFFLDVNMKGGAFLAFASTGTDINPMFGVQFSGGYVLNRNVSLRLGLGYNYLMTRINGSISTFYHGLEVFAGARFAFGGSHVPMFRFGEVILDDIFPVQYSWYSDNPFGSINLTNDEKGEIHDVIVSIFVPEFMSNPVVTLRIGELEVGASIDVSLKARFESSILDVTEARWANALVAVEYHYLDEKISVEEKIDLRILDRNAMAWDDDARAAAFVTAKDPAIQRFATTVAGVVRNNDVKPMHLNFGVALAMLEALKLQGVSYVIDPTTPYAKTSAEVGAVDYLQFPQQTLQNLGGDCDDLSILYSALLEAVGVESAFITIPGHIFVAFHSGLDYEEALKVFRNPEELIQWNNDAWLPVEITMVQEGFLPAWQKGVNEWNQYNQRFEAGFISVQEAWEIYEPIGIGSSDSAGEIKNREQLEDIYGKEIIRFLSRELDPKVMELKNRIQNSGGAPRDLNRLGTLYARYGLYELALEQLKPVAEARPPYGPAMVNVGNIYLLMEQFDESARYFESALLRDARSIPALAGLAQARFGMDDFSGADEAIGSLNDLHPELA
ncbi:MAG: hypothetical protein KAJ98_03825, partial [Spirochaetaceae bacterium]|nr:hypothetical protein [Spirochaetaceae bacterium]